MDDEERGELSPVKNHQAGTVAVAEILSGELAGYKAPKVNWSFLPEQAHGCVTVTSDATFLIPQSRRRD
jgi:hypothetical protein